MVEIIAGAIPGGTMAGGAAGAGGSLSLTIVEIMGWAATALGGMAIVIGGLVKIFGKKNGAAPAPAAAVATTDPVLLEMIRGLGDKVNETHSSTMDLRDSHVGISRDLGKIGKCTKESLIHHHRVTFCVYKCPVNGFSHVQYCVFHPVFQ